MKRLDTSRTSQERLGSMTSDFLFFLDVLWFEDVLGIRRLENSRQTDIKIWKMFLGRSEDF